MITTLAKLGHSTEKKTSTPSKLHSATPYKGLSPHNRPDHHRERMDRWQQRLQRLFTKQVY